MWLMSGSNATQLFRKAGSFFGRAAGDELDRRLERLVARRKSPAPASSALERLSISAGEVGTAPLYDQSVYGSLSLGAKEDIES